LRETDPVIAGSTEPGEDLFGGVDVAEGRIVEVTREEADWNAEFRTSVEREPVEAADKALIGLDDVRFLFGTEVVFGDPVDDHAGPIGAMSSVAVGHVEFLQHALDLGGLSDGDGEFVVLGALPNVAAAEKPGDVTHKIDTKVLRNGMLEGLFDVVGGREVGEVVNIDAEIDRGLAVNDGAGEDTRIMRAGFEAELCHGGAKGVVPVLGATA
jgi:hypothetical protein